MKKKYTPGPWTLGNGQVRVRTEEDEQGRTKLIAECYTTNQSIRYPYDFEEREANAQLISAAPELLEALQELLESIPIYPVPLSIKNDTIRKARLAIGKATAEGGAL
jgi:hypothetical protein